MGRPWWLRLDGVPPGWKVESPAVAGSARGDRFWGKYSRLVKGTSGAVYEVEARGRGVLDVIPGPLFGPPWMVSLLVHRVVYPDQYTVGIRWYQSPPPEALTERTAEQTWISRKDAEDLVDDIAGKLSIWG